MVEHHPFGKEIKKLFRPHGVGEKTYAAIVVLQVVLFAVAMSLIAGYWMWKQRQPAPSAPPVVVNMPVTPGYSPVTGETYPESVEITSLDRFDVSEAPMEVSGYVLSFQPIQEVRVSINGGESLLAHYEQTRTPSDVSTSNRFRGNWDVSYVQDHFVNGENTILVTAYKTNGTVIEQLSTIRWHKLVIDQRAAVLDIDWLSQPVRVDPWTWFSSRVADTYFGEEYTGVSVVKTGVVTTGSFSGFDVYIFTTGYCDGMGCIEQYYRTLKDPDTGEIFLLSKYSPEMFPQEIALIDKTLPNVRVPDLELPDVFELRGLGFHREFDTFGQGIFANRDEGWFTDQELVSVGQHTNWGTVYTTAQKYDEEGRTNPSNAFYLRFPDNRVRSYIFDVPFMRDGKLPQITWDGGKTNSVDYVTGDVRGCGATNAYAVRTESDLRPAERLVSAGRTSTGDAVYLLKDPNDQELKDEYTSWYPYNPDGPAEKPTLESFVAMKPIFYWKDPFNRWIRFKRADLQPMAECGKPVIYLYPEKEMPVHVMVGLKGEMTVSEPEHGTKGWDVLAKTDGYVVNQADGKTYPNLFWEGTGVGYKTPKQGFVVAQKEVAGWLEKTLAEIGFTERESAEFREFWLPRLPQSPYLFITFVPQSDFDRDAPLFISPKPDSVSRIFMEYHPLSAPEAVEPLPLPKIERRGFAVVEWGGVLR